jgi:hypothetical protein
MKQTAVEWLQDELNQIKSSSTDMDGIIRFLETEFNKVIEQAKEMEKQQQDNFAIDFFNWCNSEDAKNLLHDLVMVGEVDKNVEIEQILEIFKNK